MEFEFSADGSFRIGKGKVWTTGQYRFIDERKFQLKAKQLAVGPYEIIETGSSRLVYVRRIDGGRVQRTELTRVH